MVQMSLGNDGKHLNSDWHETRREAHEETVKIEEWDEIDRVRYDLDTVDFDTKKVDRFKFTRTDVEAEGAAQPDRDIRELPTVRD